MTYHLTTLALTADRETFVRLLILVTIIAAAATGLTLLLGPYPTTGLAITGLAVRRRRSR